MTVISTKPPSTSHTPFSGAVTRRCRKDSLQPSTHAYERRAWTLFSTLPQVFSSTIYPRLREESLNIILNAAARILFNHLLTPTREGFEHHTQRCRKDSLQPSTHAYERRTWTPPSNTWIKRCYSQRCSQEHDSHRFMSITFITPFFFTPGEGLLHF